MPPAPYWCCPFCGKFNRELGLSNENAGGRLEHLRQCEEAHRCPFCNIVFPEGQANMSDHQKKCSLQCPYCKLECNEDTYLPHTLSCQLKPDYFCRGCDCQFTVYTYPTHEHDCIFCDKFFVFIELNAHLSDCTDWHRCKYCNRDFVSAEDFGKRLQHTRRCNPANSSSG